MNIEICSEKVGDYSEIAAINYEAFLNWHPNNNYVSEPILVDLLRHNPLFDPELSLVAKVDGKIVGHVLFSPFKFIVCSKEVLGVILAPVAVHPEHQKQGIGKLLIEEGHKRAQNKGYSFSLLCGHPDYYPKFGYKTDMFSLSGSIVKFEKLDTILSGFSERPVKASDLPWLTKAWQKNHGRDKLAIFPGSNITAWNNHSPNTRCIMILKDGKQCAYLRYLTKDPSNIAELLLDDEDILNILAYILKNNPVEKSIELKLPISKETIDSMIPTNITIDIISNIKSAKPFMIKTLIDRDNIVSEYCKEAQKDSKDLGIIIFPPIFDIDDGVVD